MQKNTFNNIPIKVFYKKWEAVEGKPQPISCSKEIASSELYANGYLKANVYKYTEDGRVQLEDDYYDISEIDITTKSKEKSSFIEDDEVRQGYQALDSLVTNLFKKYAYEKGIRLDIEVIC